jgi:hypothetical protein
MIPQWDPTLCENRMHFPKPPIKLLSPFLSAVATHLNLFVCLSFLPLITCTKLTAAQQPLFLVRGSRAAAVYW